jgi:hypothetical protein|tara:strand:- start:7003 stop:7143 length:141 start_codon:yes stop_codon:yes gene_type:complete
MGVTEDFDTDILFSNRFGKDSRHIQTGKAKTTSLLPTNFKEDTKLY